MALSANHSRPPDSGYHHSRQWHATPRQSTSTHRSLNMIDILQTIFSNAFSWNKNVFVFQLKISRSFVQVVQWMITNHWFRLWLDTEHSHAGTVIRPPRVNKMEPKGMCGVDSNIIAAAYSAFGFGFDSNLTIYDLDKNEHAPEPW